MEIAKKMNENIINATVAGVYDPATEETIRKVIADHGRTKAKAILPSLLKSSVKISRSPFQDCEEDAKLFRINGLSVLVEPLSTS